MKTHRTELYILVGHEEAIAAGQLLKQNEFVFDIAYTSMLKRGRLSICYYLLIKLFFIDRNS